MRSLEDYRTALIIIGLVGILLCASPSLALIVSKFPGGQGFSRLWILDAEHTAEKYPFNVKSDETYQVYVGVGNQMRSLAYYVVYAKFKNQDEPLPNSATGTPSPLEPLYEYRLLLQDGEIRETPVSFSFSGVLFSNNESLVEIIRINNVEFNVNKLTSWNVNKTGYYYHLFIELWIYDVEIETLQFGNCSVGIPLNMTSL